MGYQKTNLAVHDSTRSPLRRYQEIVVGARSVRYTIAFEILTGLLGNLPGMLGLYLRGKLYPRLFRHVGQGVIFGRNISLLHPNRISIGDRVVIADGVSLGARGKKRNAITIGNDVVIGPAVVIDCKYGLIVIGDHVQLSHGASIGSIEGSEVEIGDYVLVAPFAYIGGVGYRTDRVDIPIALQGLDPRGGISIGDNVWLGTRSFVLDGNSVGHDAIVEAGAVVTHEVPPYGVAVGIPARVVHRRDAALATEAKTRRHEPELTTVFGG